MAQNGSAERVAALVAGGEVLRWCMAGGSPDIMVFGAPRLDSARVWTGTELAGQGTHLRALEGELEIGWDAQR